MRQETARQRVLSFLKRRKSASASEIGLGLSMSAATVRHHLSILASDGRIVADGRRSSAKRGRPQRTFRLSERLRGDNFDHLADAALGAWLDPLPALEQSAAVRGLAQRLSEQMGPINPRLPAAKRVVQLTEKLSALHYEASWEAGAQGPRVLFGHCPYTAIIGRHPELCRMDAHLLSTQMHARVEQLARIGAQPTETAHCIFAVLERLAPET